MIKVITTNKGNYKGVDRWETSEGAKAIIDELSRQKVESIAIEDASNALQPIVIYLIKKGYDKVDYASVEDADDWRISERKNKKQILIFSK